LLQLRDAAWRPLESGAKSTGPPYADRPVPGFMDLSGPRLQWRSGCHRVSAAVISV